MKYFLDTNVIIDMLKGKYSCMLNHFENTFSTDIYVPSIVVAELEYGAAHSANYEKNKSLYEKFISKTGQKNKSAIFRPSLLYCHEIISPAHSRCPGES